MNARRRLSRDEDADKAQSPAPRHERRENPETASILDLRARAGIRAIAALLEQRGADASVATLQRQPAEQAPTAEPANEGKTSAAGTMSIPEMDLEMPIISFMQQARATGRPKDSSGEVVVSIAMESLDSKIHQAAATGKQFDTITVTIGSGATFTMHSVVITNFQLGSDMATLSLNFTAMEFNPGG